MDARATWSNHPVSVVTSRLEMRPLTAAECRALLDGQAPRAVDGFPAEADLVIARLVVEGLLEPGEWGPRVVVERSSGLVVGSVGFKGSPAPAGSAAGDVAAEIGFALAPSARGRGYATEAVTAVVSWARDQGLGRVVAECDADNLASRAVLERTGFTITERSARSLWWSRTLQDGADGPVE